MNIDEYDKIHDSNLKEILEEFEELKGQFVLTYFMGKVERLIAIGDDGEDWYYVTYDGKKLHWLSCVGKLIPLKGYLRNEDYESFIRLSKLNDYDQTLDKDEFLKTLCEHYSDDLITELCWDLN